MNALKRMLAAMVAIAASFLPAIGLADTYNDGTYTWSYTVSGGKATIECGNGEGLRAVEPEPTGAVTIPSALGGYPVTKIGDRAFVYCSEMTSVVIPASVTWIGEGAFCDCHGLSELEFPKGLERIGAYAFDGCYALESLEFQNKLERIEQGAFRSCNSIQTVDIPEGVKEISVDAFSSCLNLSAAKLPASLELIDSEAFFDCQKFTFITVDEQNRNYSSVDGVLYDKTGELLVTCPAGRSYAAVVKGTKRIARGAFAHCKFMSLELPEGVTNIGESAFLSCDNLRWIALPTTLESIGDVAFCLCGRLLGVCFAGDRPTLLDSGFGGEIFRGCDNVTTYVREGTSGWGEIPGEWCGRPIEWWTTYPDVPVQRWTVTFDLGEHGTRTGGGELVQEVADGEAAVAPEVQAEEGYEFYGWDAEFSNVTGPTTVHARYVKEGQLPDGDGYTEDVNGYLWAFSIVDGEAVIEPGISPEPIGELVIPSELGGCLVTAIAESAFDNDYADMSGLTSVTIPAGVIAIGDYAFWGCSALQTVIYEGDEDEIDFGDSVFEDTPYERNRPFSLIMDGSVVTGFKGAIPQNLVIPDGVAGILEYVFSGCSGLRSVVIPASVAYIGNSAFADCCDLQAMCFAGNSPKVGEAIYGREGRWMPGTSFEWWSPSTIDENLTIYVREGTSGWGEVPGEWCGRPIEWWTTYPDVPVDETVEDGVYVVSKDGYDWTVTVEYGEVWIGDRTAWSYSEAAISPQPCGALEIPEELFGLPVVGLSMAAFMGCEGLTEVSLPQTMYSVSGYAFWGTSLQTINVDEENPYFRMQDGFLVDDWQTAILAVGKTDACAIPNGVASVPMGAFVCCPEITDLSLPSSVEVFDVAALDDCAALLSITVAEDNPNFKSVNGFLLSKDGTALVACPGGIADVVVPNGVTAVGVEDYFGDLQSPFPSGSKMRTIAIPASVGQIADGAFSACESLTEITVDSGNAVYTAANGLLMTADGRTLLACAGGCIDVVIPDGVTEIGGSVFAGSFSLRSVTAPASVQSIGAGAFSSRYFLTAVCFAGDAPEVDEAEPDDWFAMGLYEGSEYVTTYVRPGTSGWGEVPGTWHGHPLKWWTSDNPSPIPELDDDADVNQVYMALHGSKDDKLVDNILMTCLTEGDVAGADLYNSYRLWAGRVQDKKGKPLGLQSVRNSPTAWTSFALDQMTLLERNLTDEDLKIEEFKPSMEAGTFDFTVSIKDVVVGPFAMAENLKKTFGLEGATELVPSAFDEANVDIEFGLPKDGKLKFTAEPLDKDAKSFFMKMSVK